MARKPKPDIYKIVRPKKRKYTRRVVANALKEGFRGGVNKKIANVEMDQEKTASDNWKFAGYGEKMYAYDSNGVPHDVTNAQAPPDYYQTKPHINSLRKAFPGVWIREDGAFRAEEYGVRWSPHDALCSENVVGDRKVYGPRHTVTDRMMAPVMCDSIDFNRRGSELTLSQLRALVFYIETELSLVG